LGSGDIAVQPTLVSGTSIKTVNSNSLLGSGDVAVQETLVSGTNIKTLNNTSLLGSGNITLTANPSGVSGAIQFSNGSAFASDAANLFWDDTNNRLGVGTDAPSATATINGNESWSKGFTSNLRLNGASPSLQLKTSSGTGGFMIAHSGAVTYFAASTDSTFNNSAYKGNLVGNNWSFGNGVADNLGATVGIKGSGSTSATTALLVQNSAGSNLLQIRDDNSIFLPRDIFFNSLGAATLFARNNNGAGFSFGFNNSNSSASTGVSMLESSPDWFSSSSFEFATFRIQPRYDFNANTTSSAIARGIYYNPTLTNLRVANHYAWQNTSGAMIVNSTTPQASAILQADSTTQGFLPPRMTNAQRSAISSPAVGLMVYCTDAVEGLYINKSTGWTLVI